MAFLRFSRDKRGVENFYLVQPTTNRRGKVRPRVLYWFRSPPDVKMGREPFDPELRRALEAQHPDITFDWRAIVETPVPSADADKWRERRRAERAAKHAAAAEEAAEEEAETGTIEAALVDAAEPGAIDAAPADAVATPTAVSDVVSTPPAPAPGDLRRKRRRRRRGGGSGGGDRGGRAPQPGPRADSSGD